MNRSAMFILGSAFLGSLMLFPSETWAVTAGGLPWDTPLQNIKDSLTGPVASIVAFIGIAVAGLTLIFGGELGDFTRKMIMLVLVLSILLGGAAFLTALEIPGFAAPTGSGALI